MYPGFQVQLPIPGPFQLLRFKIGIYRVLDGLKECIITVVECYFRHNPGLKWQKGPDRDPAHNYTNILLKNHNKATASGVENCYVKRRRYYIIHSFPYFCR